MNKLFGEEFKLSSSIKHFDIRDIKDCKVDIQSFRVSGVELGNNTWRWEPGLSFRKLCSESVIRGSGTNSVGALK